MDGERTYGSTINSLGHIHYDGQLPGVCTIGPWPVLVVAVAREAEGEYK